MQIEETILRRISDAACKRICRAVIRSCQRIEPMLFGDDTPLKNAWEDICIQEQQADRSILWDESYGATIIQSIKWELGKLDEPTRLAIWYQTEAGLDYELELNTDPKNNSDEDLAEFILKQHVLPAADNYSNARIRKYFDRADG